MTSNEMIDNTKYNKKYFHTLKFLSNLNGKLKLLMFSKVSRILSIYNETLICCRGFSPPSIPLSNTAVPTWRIKSLLTHFLSNSFIFCYVALILFIAEIPLHFNAGLIVQSWSDYLQELFHSSYLFGKEHLTVAKWITTKIRWMGENKTIICYLCLAKSVNGTLAFDVREDAW